MPCRLILFLGLMASALQAIEPFVPKDFQGTWRMVTAFGSSAPGTWESAARELAQDLIEP